MLVEVQNANVPSIATVNDDTTASSNLSTPSTSSAENTSILDSNASSNSDFACVIEQEVLSLISSLYATSGLNRKHVQTVIEANSKLLGW